MSVQWKKVVNYLCEGFLHDPNLSKYFHYELEWKQRLWSPNLQQQTWGEPGPAIISRKEWSLQSFSNFIIKHLRRNKKFWQFTVPYPGTRYKEWSIMRTLGKFLWMTKIWEQKESGGLCPVSEADLLYRACSSSALYFWISIDSRKKQTTLQTSPTSSPPPNSPSPCSWGIEPRT